MKTACLFALLLPVLLTGCAVDVAVPGLYVYAGVPYDYGYYGGYPGYYGGVYYGGGYHRGGYYRNSGYTGYSHGGSFHNTSASGGRGHSTSASHNTSVSHSSGVRGGNHR